jgi:hypothetical protein
MSLSKTQTGLVTVSASTRETLSGDGRSQGEVMDWSNILNIVDANLDGWYQGSGTVTRTSATKTGADYYAINMGATDPLTLVGSGSFNLAFTASTTRCFAVYLEITANNTGPGAGGCPLKLQTYNVTPASGTLIASMTNVGDAVLLYNSNNGTATNSAGTPEYQVYVDDAPNAAYTAVVSFKMWALYRTAAYPV